MFWLCEIHVIHFPDPCAYLCGLFFDQPSCQIPSSSGFKVYDALENGAVPEPFPIQEQYVKAVKAKAAAAEDEASDAANPEIGKRKPKSRKEKPSSCNKADKDESSWNYSAIKSDFIGKKRKEEKLSYNEAKEQWDSSQEKRDILGPLTVPELKRRRFIEKTCEVNPWA